MADSLASVISYVALAYMCAAVLLGLVAMYRSVRPLRVYSHAPSASDEHAQRRNAAMSTTGTPSAYMVLGKRLATSLVGLGLALCVISVPLPWFGFHCRANRCGPNTQNLLIALTGGRMSTPGSVNGAYDPSGIIFVALAIVGVGLLGALLYRVMSHRPDWSTGLWMALLVDGLAMIVCLRAFWLDFPEEGHVLGLSGQFGSGWYLGVVGSLLIIAGATVPLVPALMLWAARPSHGSGLRPHALTGD